MRGVDSNSAERAKIIQAILDRAPEGTDKKSLKEILETSGIKDITGYGRVVHAEMEAIISCARNAVSCRDATMYCTTFPCHNCAKHIIAAGVKNVVFIEPYRKSKAAEFHSDSIRVEPQSVRDRITEAAEAPDSSKPLVDFRPFIGVGPRQFFDLFSMRLSSGYPLVRKKSSGQVVQWTREKASLRLKMYPLAYLDLEAVAFSQLEQFMNQSAR
jgi:deoxycytidylate deaminase